MRKTKFFSHWKKTFPLSGEIRNSTIGRQSLFIDSLLILENLEEK
jgi:hypothetical protein